MNLSIQIFLSLVLSVVVGLMLGEGAAAPVKMWIAPIGTMFINLIKMMIVPVVFCSLIVGMTSMGDMKKLGRIGVKTLVIYMVTTAIAIVIGFAVAMAIDRFLPRYNGYSSNNDIRRGYGLGLKGYSQCFCQCHIRQCNQHVHRKLFLCRMGIPHSKRSKMLSGR